MLQNCQLIGRADVIAQTAESHNLLIPWYIKICLIFDLYLKKLAQYLIRHYILPC